MARSGTSTPTSGLVWAVAPSGRRPSSGCGNTGRYVDEFAFRLNEGNCGRRTLDRLDSFVDGMAGKRLTYKALVN